MRTRPGNLPGFCLSGRCIVRALAGFIRKLADSTATNR